MESPVKLYIITYLERIWEDYPKQIQWSTRESELIESIGYDQEKALWWVSWVLEEEGIKVGFE